MILSDALGRATRAVYALAYVVGRGFDGQEAGHTPRTDG